jgi:hypothetical protein
MNKGFLDIEGIIGTILFVIVFLIAISGIFSVINTTDSRINEINRLKKENDALRTNNLELQKIIAQKDSVILAMDNSIGEKEKTISDLTGNLSDTNQEILRLLDELSYYSEKKYMSEINNNYYNILNNISYIENKFYYINIYLTLLSITLLALIGKMFGIKKLVIKIYKKIVPKEKKTEIKVEK